MASDYFMQPSSNYLGYNLIEENFTEWPLLGLLLGKELFLLKGEKKFAKFAGHPKMARRNVC